MVRIITTFLLYTTSRFRHLSNPWKLIANGYLIPEPPVQHVGVRDPEAGGNGPLPPRNGRKGRGPGFSSHLISRHRSSSTPACRAAIRHLEMESPRQGSLSPFWCPRHDHRAGGAAPAAGGKCPCVPCPPCAPTPPPRCVGTAPRQAVVVVRDRGVVVCAVQSCW